MIEFRPWPKIARLYREMVISEKIDGTHAAVGIQKFPFGWHLGGACYGECGYPDWESHDHSIPDNATMAFSDTTSPLETSPDFEYIVYAQSRNRIIVPGADNHGFAGWVWDNAKSLAATLGEGVHYGEYWGSGINRGYGLTKGEKRFSLFNTSRWSDELLIGKVTGLGVVPVLYQGVFDTFAIDVAKMELREHGSYASPGFMRPEGVVIYHAAANQMFKTTLDDDEQPKTLAMAVSAKPRYEQLVLAA